MYDIKNSCGTCRDDEKKDEGCSTCGDDGTCEGCGPEGGEKKEEKQD